MTSKQTNLSQQQFLQQSIIQHALAGGGKEALLSILQYDWKGSFLSEPNFTQALTCADKDVSLLQQVWQANKDQGFTPLSKAYHASSPSKSFVQLAILSHNMPLLNFWIKNQDLSLDELKTFNNLLTQEAMQDPWWRKLQALPKSHTDQLTDVIADLKVSYQKFRWMRETTPHGWVRHHGHAPFEVSDLDDYLSHAKHPTSSLIAQLLLTRSPSSFTTKEDPQNILGKISTSSLWGLFQSRSSLVWHLLSGLQKENAAILQKQWDVHATLDQALEQQAKQFPLAWLQHEMKNLRSHLLNKPQWKSLVPSVLQVFEKSFDYHQATHPFEALVGKMECQMLINKNVLPMTDEELALLKQHFPSSFQSPTENHDVWGLMLGEYAKSLPNDELVLLLPKFHQVLSDIPQDDQSKGQYLRTMWRILREEETPEKRATLSQLLWTGVCMSGPKTLYSWIRRFNETQKVTKSHPNLDMSYPFPRYDLFESVLADAMKHRLDPASQKILIGFTVMQSPIKAKSSNRKM